MQIKPFAQAATAAGAKVVIKNTSDGYICEAVFSASKSPIQVLTQLGKVRVWKTLDRLVKGLSDQHFVGDITMRLDNQQTLV